MIRDEPSGNRLEGTYRGIVLKHLPHGRCKIFIPGVYAPVFAHDPDLLPSAQPKTPLFAGTNNGNGVFSYPNLSSIVWCTFMNGDANLPVFDSATLGGENAMGQYELIKKASEPVSDRHMITSGKTHMLWYEKGKLSGIVEDPIRTYCSVDYDQFELENNNTSVENRYSYQISNDIVSRISKNLLSNINCQYVLDNGAGRHGELSTSTHWYHIIDENISAEQFTCKGAISTDNRNIMNNDGVIELGTLSTYTAFSDDKKNHVTDNSTHRVDNEFRLDVPGNLKTYVDRSSKTDYQDKSQTTSKKETLSVRTSSTQDTNATVDFNSIYQLTSNYVNGQLKQAVNLTSDLENQFLMEAPGTLDLSSHLQENTISTDGNSSKTFAKKLDSTAEILTDTGSHTLLQTVSSLNLVDLTSGQGITTNVQLTDTYEMDSSGNIGVSVKKSETTMKTAGNEVIKIKASSQTDIDPTGKHISKASHYNFHSINNTPIELNNQSVIGMENKTDSKLRFQANGKKTVNGSPVIDSQFSNIINTSTSTANIQIVDNLANKECISNMNAKLGLTEIRITNKGSGAHCTIRLDAEGKMTIDTSDSLAVTTTNAVSITTNDTTVTSPTVTINGNTKIDGTLLVTGATTIDNTLNVSSSATVKADATIGGKSFLGHMHIGNMGAPTSPPV